MLDRCMALMERIPDREEQSSTVAWFLSTSARFLTRDEKERLKERLKNMVDLVKEIAEEEYARGEAKGEARGEAKKAAAVAKAMLAKGLDIALVSEVTGIPTDDLERFRRELSN